MRRAWSLFLFFVFVSSKVHCFTFDFHRGGFFAQFLLILGALDFLENGHCSKVVQVGGKDSLLFDKNLNSCWWKNYFEEAEWGGGEDKAVFSVEELMYNYKKMSRSYANFRIQKYIHIKPHIIEKIESFYQIRMEGLNFIGVHYRGTDKNRYFPRCPYKEMFAYMDAHKKKQPSSKFFIATDEEAFLAKAIHRYGEDVVYCDHFRSTTGEGVHRLGVRENRYLVGEEALIDCLLLAKCPILLRTVSNLSTAASFFNPTSKVVMVEG